MAEIDRAYERLLALRCRTGDVAALEELVRLFQPRLLLYLRKLLGRGPHVEDAMQDVWMDVHRGIHRLADPAALRPWLYRIAHLRACRSLRRKTRQLVEIEQADDLAEEPEDSFSAEDAAAVHAALEKLSVEHRAALTLRFIEQMDYQQMAQVVGCDVGTIRSRLHYAKRHLRRILEGNDHA